MFWNVQGSWYVILGSNYEEVTQTETVELVELEQPTVVLSQHHATYSPEIEAPMKNQ